MKNYLNAEERTRHIILLAMQENAKDLAQSQALTPKEKQMLNKITEWCLKFNASLFERFGGAYARKIQSTMQVNTLKLVGKYAEVAECINHIASQDHEYMINELKAFKCLGCEREDFKNCGMYCACIACDIADNGNETGCPFKTDILEIEEEQA